MSIGVLLSLIKLPKQSEKTGLSGLLPKIIIDLPILKGDKHIYALIHKKNETRIRELYNMEVI
jgi:hypothetical protein